MAEPVFLDFPSAEMLPAVPEIAEMARSTPCLVLRFPTKFEIIAPGYPVAHDAASDFKKRLVEELIPLLPNYSVFDAGGCFDEDIRNNLDRRPVGAIVSGISRLTLMKVISEEKVLAHADAVVLAAQRFRQTASELASRLAAKLSVPREAFANPLFRLEHDPSGHNPVTALDADWTYWFHGFECLFTNTRTGQRVEIKFGYLNEFGVLDPYFFVKFLQTTPELRSLAQLFEEEFHDTRRALEILERYGRLKRVEGTSPQHTGLVALPE